MFALAIAFMFVVIVGFGVFLEYVVIGWWMQRNEASVVSAAPKLSHMGRLFWKGWRITDSVNPEGEIVPR